MTTISGKEIDRVDVGLYLNDKMASPLQAANEKLKQFANNAAVTAKKVEADIARVINAEFKERVGGALSRGDAAVKEFNGSIGRSTTGLKKLQEPLSKTASLAGMVSTQFMGMSGAGGQAVNSLAMMAGVLGTTGPLGIGLAAIGIAVADVISKNTEMSDRVKAATKEMVEQSDAYKQLVENYELLIGRITKSVIEDKRLQDEVTKERTKLIGVTKELKEAQIQLGDIGGLKASLETQRDLILETVLALQRQRGVLREMDKDEAERKQLRAAEEQAKKDEEDRLRRQKEWLANQVDINDGVREMIAAVTGVGEADNAVNRALERMRWLSEDLYKKNALVVYSNDATDALAILNAEMDKFIVQQQRAIFLQQQGAQAFGPVLGFGSFVGQSGMLEQAPQGNNGTRGGGIRVGVSGGLTSAGTDIVSGIASPAAAAGLSTLMAGGGASAAIGAAAASVGPQIAIAIGAAIASAIAAAASAPFVVAGMIAGKLFTDGIISKITGLPDAIFEAVLADKPIEKIREFIGQAFEQFQQIGQYIGPVIDEVIRALPLLLERAARTFLTVLVQVLNRTPDLITAIVVGLQKAFALLIQYLPTIIKELIPVLIQALILGLAASGAIVAAIGPLGFLLTAAIVASLATSIKDAFGRGDVWASVSKTISDTMAALFVPALTPIIESLNDWIRKINDVAGLGIPLIPVPTMPGSYSTSVGDYGTGGDDGSGGDGSSYARMPSRNDLPVFHDGGMVGKAIYAHRGMYVGGSRSDEVPIIAQTGEAVLSRAGVQRAGGSGGVAALNSGGAVVTVNIHGHTVESARLLLREMLMPEMQRLGLVGAVAPNGWRW